MEIQTVSAQLLLTTGIPNLSRSSGKRPPANLVSHKGLKIICMKLVKETIKDIVCRHHIPNYLLSLYLTIKYILFKIA